jgi:hypothetical protein
MRMGMAVLAILGGCGDNAAFDLDAVHSGTRLQLTWYELDGVRTWDADAPLHDIARDETCRPAAWSDGRTYCTPVTTSDVAYADAACTKRIARGAGALSIESQYVCDRWIPHRLFTVGAARSGPFWLRAGDGSCNQDGNSDTFELGPEVPVSELAELATHGVGPRQSAFTVDWMSSADGLAVPVALRDHALDITCRFHGNYAADEARCYPEVHFAPSERYFATASCTGTPAIAIPTACPATSVMLVDGTYRALGPVVATSPVFTTDGATCIAAIPAPASTLRSVGAELPTQMLPRRVDETSSRIAAIRLLGDRATLRDGLRDTELDVECVITLAADGLLRCLPATYSFVPSLFTDAACTVPIDLAWVLSDGSGYAASMYANKSRPTATPDVFSTAVYPLGQPYTAQVYANRTGCAPFSPGSLPLYTVGAELPPSRFVPAVALRE